MTPSHPETPTGRLAGPDRRLFGQGAHPGAVEDRIMVAGRLVAIRYQNTALAEMLTRATHHLSVADNGTSADLTIVCGTDHDLTPRLPAIWPRTGTSFSDDGVIVFTWDAPDGPLFAYDRSQGTGWACFASVESVPPWEQATPFRRILHWWAADQGLSLIHTAAVGRPQGGVLVVGRSGSGKSTTALACLQAGLGLAGDDYCLLAPGDPSWVHGLYLSAKGDARSAALLPGLAGALARSPLTTHDKAIIFTDELGAEEPCTDFPLRAIVVPRLSRERTSSLSPLPRAAAFRALAPSAVLEIPGGRAANLARLSRIVSALPAWELTLGPDPAEAADLIIELLEQRIP